MNENQDINVNTEVQGEQETPSNTQEVQEKMLPQSKVNEVVEGRLKREREKLNKEWQEKFDALQESIKLNAMSEQEKANYQAQKEKEDFEKEKQAFYAERDAFNHAKYKQTIEQQLQAKGLPTDLADLLTDYDAETVASKIASMEKSFNTQVNNSIQDRVKASASTPIAPTQEQQGLLSMEQIKAMSTQDIIKNKELVDKSLDAIYGQK